MMCSFFFEPPCCSDTQDDDYNNHRNQHYHYHYHNVSNALMHAVNIKMNFVSPPPLFSFLFGVLCAAR